MSDNQALVAGLISGIEFGDARLKDALTVLIADVYETTRQLNPPTSVSQDLTPTPSAVTGPPTNFTLAVFQNNIRLSWDAPGPGTFLYEIRLGSTYATATILLTTASFSADIDPVSRHILTEVPYTFWITTVDDLGDHSTPVSVSVTIPAMGAPVLSASVLGNNVLLNWTIPFSTFTISYYTIYRNGIFHGNINGTFHIIAEPLAGTYSYDVEAYDIVGNWGPLSGVTNIIVTNPPDYQQFGSILSTFTGALVNTVVESGELVAIVDTKSWEDHFIDNSWNTIQDQINAGYPLYFQPGPASGTGTYEEVFDFGSILDDVIANVSYSVSNVSGVISISTDIAVSDDNITYTGFVNGVNQFIVQLRYVKVKLTFTGSDTSAIRVSGLRVSLNVRVESEEGRVSALSTDVSGTPIVFTKPFESIRALVLVPESTTACFAVYDNLTNTGANVFVFDSGGVRVSRMVSWLVRGLL